MSLTLNELKWKILCHAKILPNLQFNFGMSLVLNELKLIAIQSNSNTTSELAPQVKRSNVIVCKTTSGNLGGSTPDERSHSVKGQL